MKQHKWHKEIKHLADGGEIEYRTRLVNNSWTEWTLWDEAYFPEFNGDSSSEDEYRIKPQPKEPQYLYVYEDSYYSPDDRDTRASTRIMSKRIKDWECNYIGKIKLEVEDD